MRYAILAALAAASVQLFAAPTLAQTTPPVGCDADGYCPVFGVDGTTIIYWTRPQSFFASEDGQRILEAERAAEAGATGDSDNSEPRGKRVDSFFPDT